MRAGADYTLDELVCVTMARLINDGDVLLEGIGAFLPTAGYELARLSHAPSVLSWSSISSVFRYDFVPLSLSGYERASLEAGIARTTYGEIAMRYIPRYVRARSPTWKEFVRPAQIDVLGNTNNVVIGDYRAPSVRLPGAIGIPDGSTVIPETFFYLPRHQSAAIIERVDFVSGAGFRDASQGRSGNPGPLITSLGVFGFRKPRGIYAISLHPGVEAEDVRRQTGCEVVIERDTPETLPPEEHHVKLLRTKIDPLNLRRLEFLSKTERLRAIRDAADGIPVGAIG